VESPDIPGRFSPSPAGSFLKSAVTVGIK